MQLNDWCSKAEELKAALSDEYWKMNVGLPFNKDRIAAIEKENASHAESFLSNFREPFPLLLDAVDSIASGRTYDLYMQLHELRKSAIASSTAKLNGQPMNWSTWRQWAASAPDRERKRVFDEFISLAPAISPVIKKRFEAIFAVYKAFQLDPLDAYCKDHKMSLQHLKKVLHQLRDGVRHEFAKQLRHYCKELVGREPEHHDDFYWMRNAVFSTLPKVKADALKGILATAKELGFDPSIIQLDKEDRADKYASPFCSFVRIPTDVRVSYKAENPVNDMNSLYHEYGHALHAITIRPELPYWTKYVTSNGLNETFSILFESLIHDSGYLHRQLGIALPDAEEIVKRIRFTRLFSVALYCANSLFRVEALEKSVPFEQWDALYAGHYKDCTGISMPGSYWQLHHILSEAVMYVPSYLLADIRASEIIGKCRQEWGRQWWKEKAAGIHIRNLMKDGADSPASIFESIDPKPFISELTCEK